MVKSGSIVLYERGKRVKSRNGLTLNIADIIEVKVYQQEYLVRCIMCLTMVYVLFTR